MLIAKHRISCLNDTIVTFCPQLELVKGNHYRTWADDHGGKLYGDYPLPAGMTEAMIGNNAEYIIRVKPEVNAEKYNSAAYEIGVVPMDYERDNQGNVIVDAQGNPKSVYYRPDSQFYGLCCDQFLQGCGILECEGVGKYREEKGKPVAFDQLYMEYQVMLNQQVAKENGDAFSWERQKDGSFISLTSPNPLRVAIGA